MADWLKEDPLIIERGEGSYLFDTEGRRYVDGNSSLWVNIHGHNRPEISMAIQKQLERLEHATMLGLSHPQAILLAERLIKVAPRCLSRVFYSDTGAAAVEIALKMAFQYWQNLGETQRTTFLCLKNGYHGDTLGAISVGGIDAFHKIFAPLLFKGVQIQAPYCFRCPWQKKPETCNLECLKALENAFEEHHFRACGIIVEPKVQAAGGMIVHPDGYLKKVRDLSDRYGLLMIVDEVATGFGRTGKMFACEHEGVSPDILTLAKGITGGYLPLAATLTREKVFEAFLGTTFYHGHTYTGNPLACTAAIASLELFQKDATLADLPMKSEVLKGALSPFKQLPYVGEVRQLGLMVGIELVKDKETKEPYPLELGVGHRVTLQARKLGAIVRPLGDVLVLMPPLATPKDILHELAVILFEATKAAMETF
jgi:adenosylmethionine-8-amino-7-oxononanoate aminotransferase